MNTETDYNKEVADHFFDIVLRLSNEGKHALVCRLFGMIEHTDNARTMFDIIESVNNHYMEGQ